MAVSLFPFIIVCVVCDLSLWHRFSVVMASEFLALPCSRVVLLFWWILSPAAELSVYSGGYWIRKVFFFFAKVRRESFWKVGKCFKKNSAVDCNKENAARLPPFLFILVDTRSKKSCFFCKGKTRELLESRNIFF